MFLIGFFFRVIKSVDRKELNLVQSGFVVHVYLASAAIFELEIETENSGTLEAFGFQKVWPIDDGNLWKPSLCYGLLSVVRPSVPASVCPLTFSLNIFFSETIYRILMKFHRNVPAMVLFRHFLNNLIPSKTLVAMATKLKKIFEIFENLLVRNHKA